MLNLHFPSCGFEIFVSSVPLMVLQTPFFREMYRGAAKNVIFVQPTKAAMTLCGIDPGRWIDVRANFLLPRFQFHYLDMLQDQTKKPFIYLILRTFVEPKARKIRSWYTLLDLCCDLYAHPHDWHVMYMTAKAEMCFTPPWSWNFPLMKKLHRFRRLTG